MSDFSLTNNIYDLDQLSIGGQPTDYAGGAEDRNFQIYSAGALMSWGFERYPFHTTTSIVSLGSGYDFTTADGKFTVDKDTGNVSVADGATVDGVDVSAKDADTVDGSPFAITEANPNDIMYWDNELGTWTVGYDHVLGGGGYTLSSAQKTDLTDAGNSALHYHQADREANHNAHASIQGGSPGGDPSEAYHLTSLQHTDLTDAGDSALHYHATDRSRTNHTGTQAAATISDFPEAVHAQAEYLCLALSANQATTTAIPFTDFTWNSRAKSSGMTHTNGNANFTLPTPAAGETHIWEFVYSLGSDYNANNATARAPLLQSSGASWATVATPGMHGSTGPYLQIPGVWSVAVTSASELSFKMQHYVSTAAAGKYWKTDRTFWNIKRIAVEYA